MRQEVRFSGIGGQGMVLASMILAEAAGIYRGLHVVQTQFYGYAIRGGAATGDVVLSDQPVVYPWVHTPDIFVVMAQPAMASGWRDVRQGGVIIADTVHVTQVPAQVQARVYRVPVTRLADESGTRKGVNIVALGALAKLTDVVDYGSLEKAVLARVPRGTEEANRKALQLGYGVDASTLEVVQPGIARG